MITLSKLPLLVCLTLALSSAPYSARAQTITQNRPLREVRAVKVDRGIALYIRQGPREALTLEADSEVMSSFVSEINDGILTLTLDKNLLNPHILKAHLTVLSLESLDASGGSEVYSQGVLQAEKMRCRLSGGSDARLELSVKNLMVQISGGADAHISGLAATLNLTASGGSDFKGRDLRCDHATVRASGAADVHVYADLDLGAEASGAASIYYYGNPKQVQQRTSGNGEIKKR